MRAAMIAAMLLFSTAAGGAVGPAAREPLSFERRVVAVLNAGGTADMMQGRLTAIGSGMGLTLDQRIAIDALKTLVRSRGKPSGLSLAEAEAFAAQHPSSPASAFLIAEAALANRQPERSADKLIETAPRAGPLVQLVSPTAVSKLTDELDARSERKRIADLAKALLYSGWGRGSVSLRSYLALTAIRDELAAGRVDRARALVKLVKSPATLHEILIDGRLAALRGDVEAMAGPRLEKAWRAFLTSTRDDWLQRGDALSATAFAEALKQASQYEALANNFLARFTKGYNCANDMVARSIGPDLADSLARTGRWAKAEDVMRRSGGVSPPTYAAMLLERGDFGRAGTLFERSLKAANVPNGRTEEKALAWLRAASACAAYRSGGGGLGAPYDPALLDISARIFVQLCLDRPASAKAALIASLANEEERSDALRWVQPFNDPAAPSKFREEMNQRIRTLQGDPEVTAAVSRYGTILDWPLSAAVAQMSDLTATKGTSAWQCGEEADWQTAMPEVESIRLPDTQP